MGRIFLRPERVLTPIGESEGIAFGVVLEVEPLLAAYRAAVAERDATAALSVLFEVLTCAGLDCANAQFGYEVLVALAGVVAAMDRAMSDLPAIITVSDPNRKEPEAVPYDYTGRGAVYLVHTLARHYHWTEEAILALHPRSAFRYIQEIEVAGFYDREWEYRLSEIAYPYNEALKKSIYQPLKAPFWMTGERALPKSVMIPVEFMPVGEGIRMPLPEGYLGRD